MIAVRPTVFARECMLGTDLRMHLVPLQISRIRLSEMLRRRSTPFVSEEEGQQLRQRLQANAKKISLEVPGLDDAPPPPASSGGRRVGGNKAARDIIH